MGRICACINRGCWEYDPNLHGDFYNSTCETTFDGYCFTHVDYVEMEDDGLEKNWQMGCLPGGIEGLLQCKGAQTRSFHPKAMKCCSGSDYCNLHIAPIVEEKFDVDVLRREQEANLLYQPYLISGVALMFLVLSLLAVFLRIKKRSGKKSDFESSVSDSNDLMGSNTSRDGFTPLLDNFSAHPKTVLGNIPMFIDGKFNFPNGSSSFDTSQSMTGSAVKYGQISSCSQTSSSLSSDATQQTTIHSLAPISEDSGISGTRGNFMRQKTMSETFNLIRMIGQGRYSRVWLAERRQTEVAVKIYLSRDQAAFAQEMRCYQYCNLRHPNILTHLWQDLISKREVLEFWLISDYHPLGSLNDYLKSNPILSVGQMISLFKSIVSGLNHLHRKNINSKAGIAHRDLKSKTILMKSPTECCISDFGTSVMSDVGDDFCQPPHKDAHPYVRYMAPEVLDESIDLENFAAHCSADIYSLGLVFWEIYNRLVVNGITNGHQLPFENVVPEDITETMMYGMRKVVCEGRQRPAWNPLVQNDPTVVQLQGIIKEAWAQNPSSRVTAYYIKKKMINFYEQYQQ